MPALSKLGETDTIITFIIGECRKYSCVGVFETFDATHITDEILAIITVSVKRDNANSFRLYTNPEHFWGA